VVPVLRWLRPYARLLRSRPQALGFPFVKIVGQEDMKLALQLNVVDARIGGVLIMGDRGTGKSVAVRALHAQLFPACLAHATQGLCPARACRPSAGRLRLDAHSLQVRALIDLLPEINIVAGDNYNSDPEDPQQMGPEARERYAKGLPQPTATRRIPMIEVPLGATEDRICGTIDIERALSDGVKARDAIALCCAPVRCSNTVVWVSISRPSSRDCWPRRTAASCLWTR